MDNDSTPSVPEIDSRWLHRSGKEYVVIAVANEHATKPDYPVTVVYRDMSGNTWSRPLSNWHQSMAPAPASEQPIEAIAEPQPLYTLEHIKEAYDDGYYEGAGDDAWYKDHDEKGNLLSNSCAEKPMREFIETMDPPALVLDANTFAAITSGNGELPPSQEPKYTVRNGRIVNRASGEAIPDDEPVFVFLARDKHAKKVLENYSSVVTGSHYDAVSRRIKDFQRFAESFPERMKTPDTEDVSLTLVEN